MRVRDEYDKVQQAGGEVALITMGRPEQVRQFRDYLKLPFVLLSDPDQAAYRAFHVPRGGLLDVAGPRTWLAGALAIVTRGAGQIIGDPYQLPGSFVIDRSGRIALAHYSRTSADLPENAELLAALEKLKPTSSAYVPL